MKPLDFYLVEKKRISLHIGARPSPLAQIQVEEVIGELKRVYPSALFSIQLSSIHTQGDFDQKTSLKNLNKTSFFTEEIDSALLSGRIRLGIHSAKDLPEPLPSGIQLICLTKGLDPSDSLVLREREDLQDLPTGSRIGTSSLRRELAVLRLRPDFRISDIRGTIGERLQQLTNGTIDGVVVAEAALIRLRLTHLNRIVLPDCHTPLQGRLAILSRENDLEMAKLFAPLDTRLIHG